MRNTTTNRRANDPERHFVGAHGVRPLRPPDRPQRTEMADPVEGARHAPLRARFDDPETGAVSGKIWLNEEPFLSPTPISWLLTPRRATPRLAWPRRPRSESR